MKSRRIFHVLRVIAIVMVAFVVFGFVTMHLWNWLMPAIFGLRAISFVQGLGLVILSKILFGGFHRHGGGPRGWRRNMQERWAQMTPEERDRLRAGMRGRWGCGGSAASERGPEQSSV
jgi:hypothetical protein